MICEWKWHWRPYFLDLSLVDKHNFLFFFNHNVKNITQLSSSKQRKHLYRSMDYFLHQHADIFVLANYLVITCVSLEFSSTKGGETTLTPIMGALSQWWVMTFHKSFAAATDSRAQSNTAPRDFFQGFHDYRKLPRILNELQLPAGLEYLFTSNPNLEACLLKWKTIIHFKYCCLSKKWNIFSRLFQYSERTIVSTNTNYTSKESLEPQLLGARSTLGGDHAHLP